jgi:outer membrane lipopolysaccharide assembly protein LptE/RlpB
MRTQHRLAATLLLSAALLSGCGYALVGRSSNLPADIRAVYIKPLENRTQRTQVEQFLTRAIADELVTRKRFSVVGSEGEATAELSGAVVAFGVTPVTFDASGRATEYEISITAAVAFKRTGEDKPLWSNDHYNFRESYPVEVSETAYFDREDQAIERASKRFAQTMVSDLLEGF